MLDTLNPPDRTAPDGTIAFSSSTFGIDKTLRPFVGNDSADVTIADSVTVFFVKQGYGIPPWDPVKHEWNDAANDPDVASHPIIGRTTVPADQGSGFHTQKIDRM